MLGARYLLILVVALAATTSTAHAGCGPEVELEIDHYDRSNTGDRYGDQYIGHRDNRENKIGLSLTWFLGDDRCEDKASSSLRSTQLHNESTKIRNQREKIKVCKDFTLTTAPQSIRSFCGDLLN